jgi:hypothetical protein
LQFLKKLGNVSDAARAANVSVGVITYRRDAIADFA